MTDVGPIKSGSVTDEYALFLSDIFPTGYMAAVNAPVQRATPLRSGLRSSRTVHETGDDAIADFKVIDFEPRSITSPMFSWPRKSIQLEEIARSVMEET
jgi:hypothetical protein